MNISLPKASDPEIRRVAKVKLFELTTLDGEEMTYLDAIIQVNLDKAVKEKDIRAAQFIIGLVGNDEQNGQTIKTATLDPLDALRAKIKPSNIIDRRKKAD